MFVKGTKKLQGIVETLDSVLVDILSDGYKFTGPKAPNLDTLMLIANGIEMKAGYTCWTDDDVTMVEELQRLGLVECS